MKRLLVSLLVFVTPAFAAAQLTPTPPVAPAILELPQPASVEPSPFVKRPYFDHVGTETAGYKTSVGVLFTGKGDPAKTALLANDLALLLHKADPYNSILPASWARAGYAETWAISAGIANGGGDHIATLGPSLNVMPWMLAPVYNFLMAHTAPGDYVGLKNIFNPLQIGSGDVAIGPRWTLKVPIHNGAFMPPNQWKGAFMAWAGKSWTF